MDKSFKEELKRSFDIEVFSDITASYEAPQPYGRGIFSLLLRRERNPSEAEISSHSSLRLRSGFSAKGDKSWIYADIVVLVDGRLQVLIARVLTWLKRKPMVVFGHSGPGADDKWNLLCSPDVFVAFSSYQEEWAEKFSWDIIVGKYDKLFKSLVK